MEQAYFIMPIHSRSKAVRNDIDVYLQSPLDELYGLWIEGLEAYKANAIKVFCACCINMDGT